MEWRTEAAPVAQKARGRCADLAVAQSGGSGTAHRDPVHHIREQHQAISVGTHSEDVKSWTKKIPCFDWPVACFRSGYSAISGETRVPTIT